MITPVANGLVYTHAQTVINNGDHSNQIAIVNEDKGVVNAKGETVRYSDQFLPSYNKDGYIVTSLDEARNSGYLAYVVVPSSFSSNVESINTQPTQSVLGYYIVDEAHANEATMKIVQLEMNLNRDIGKLYVGSVLSEFFQAQDNAEIVLNNSNINSEAISQLANTDFIRTIDLKPLELPEAPDGSGLARVEDGYIEHYNEAMGKVKGTYNTEVGKGEKIKNNALDTYAGAQELLESSVGKTTEAQNFYKNVQRVKYRDNVSNKDFYLYVDIKGDIKTIKNGFEITMGNGEVFTSDNFQILDWKNEVQSFDIRDDVSSIVVTWNDGKPNVFAKSVNGRSVGEDNNINIQEKIKKYLEEDDGIKESNNHILLQNSINYLDLLYFDVISEFVTGIVTDPSLATQAHFNELMQIRFNKYGNNISVAINQFNQYSEIKINNIQDYINLRTGQYQKIAANYDFANHNLDKISTTIISMLDTAQNTYNSSNDIIDNKAIMNIGTISNDKGIGKAYLSNVLSLDINNQSIGQKITDSQEIINGIIIDKELKVDPIDNSGLQQVFLPVKDFVQELKDNNMDITGLAGLVNSENSKLISDYQAQTNNDLQARVENLENVNNATSVDNKNLIGDFATKLRYSRTGNVPNKTVVDAMTAPLSVTNDGDVKGSVTVPTVNKRDEEETQKSNVNPWVIGLGITTAVLASYIVGDAVFSRKKNK